MSVKNDGKDKDKGKPDTTGNIPTTVVCDQCGHPKKAHRQQKYYCEADEIQSDPIHSNEKIKVMCSCTGYKNAEEDKKGKEEHQPAQNVKSPKPNIKEVDAGQTIPLGIVEVTDDGGIASVGGY